MKTKLARIGKGNKRDVENKERRR